MKFDRGMNVLAVITCFCYTYRARLTVKWHGISMDNLSTRASKHLEYIVVSYSYPPKMGNMKICQRTSSICKQIVRICGDRISKKNVIASK